MIIGNLSNLTITVLVLVICCLAPSLAILCPPATLIEPCTCIRNFNQISCNNLHSNVNLRLIFSKLAGWLRKQNVNPIFDELKVSQSGLEQLGDDVLAGVAFRHISVALNPTLRRISELAFESSFNTTTDFVLEENGKLGLTEVDSVELFRAINRFEKLNTLHLNENGISVIPDNAFDRKQPVLRELIMTENQIERIGNNAFTSLSSLELINLDGNQISKLAPSALEIHTSNSQSLLRIFLRNNKLTDQSFPPGVFSKLRVRVFLNLNMNRISRVPQNIFESFHHRKSVLTLVKNPIECDCDLRWLVEANALYHSSQSPNSYMLRDFHCSNSSLSTLDLFEEDKWSDCEPPVASHQTIEQCLERATDANDEDLCINQASPITGCPLLLLTTILVILLKP